MMDEVKERLNYVLLRAEKIAGAKGKAFYGRGNQNPFDIFVLDMDGTLINHPEYSHHSSWQRTFETFPLEKRELADRLKEKYYFNRDPAAQNRWAEEQAQLMKDEIVPKLSKNYLPGLEEFVGLKKKEGSKFYISSTGVKFLAEEIEGEMGFDDVLANEPVTYLNGSLRFKGEVNIHLPIWEKKNGLHVLSKRHDFDLTRVVCLGDSDNDIGPFEEVKSHGGLAVAINTADENVRAAADIYVSDYFVLMTWMNWLNEIYGFMEKHRGRV